MSARRARDHQDPAPSRRRPRPRSIAPREAAPRSGCQDAEVDDACWGMAAHARATPDKAAMVLGDEVRTYAQLADRSARLATVLRERGVPDAGTGAVAAMVPNGFEFFEVAAAACRAEARFLPVNWHLKSAELAWILADSGAQVLVADQSLRAYVDAALLHAPG